MSPNRVVVRLHPGSDADPTHVPKQGDYTQVTPPTLYLEKIADQWMASKGEARPGVKYILEALPAGYTMWQRPRISDARHVDKYLYGHPSQKQFDSPNRFYPHFEHIMANGGSSIGCQCTVCCGSAGVLPRASPNNSRMRSGSGVTPKRSTASNTSVPMHNRPSGRTSTVSVTRVPSGSVVPLPGPVAHKPVAYKGRPKTISAGVDDTSNVDLEGTPDIYRNLVDKLRQHGHVDQPIQEPLSPDWRADQEILPEMLANIKTKEHWLPRNGDIILYIRDLPEGVQLVRHEIEDTIKLYDEEKGEFDIPEWRAGLVTEMATGATIADLVDEDASMNVSRSGVRVEPIPNPNDADKSMSKQHKYVYLRQTCPFVLWQELLKHVPEDDWHPTIKNALTLSGTLSLMGKYRFRGTWPEAQTYCHGMHLGSEMMTVGDTLRLLPRTNSLHQEPTDILVIKSIRLKFTNLDKASENDYDEGRPYNSQVWVYGSGYTSDASRADKQWLSDKNVEPPEGAMAYSDWHPLHPPDKELAVPYHRIFGRLFERDAMAYFLKADPKELLGLDLGWRAVLKGREYAQEHDERISQELNATWFWGDDRADALGLHTLNGLDVSNFDEERNIKEMRKQYRILDGMGNGQPRTDEAKPASSSRGLRGLMAPPTNGLSHAQSMSDSSTAGSSDGERSTASKKRPRITDLTDDEVADEDEDKTEMATRQQTRHIDDIPAPKKARVDVDISGAPHA